MPRHFDATEFRRKFDQYIAKGEFNETPDYYPRYRSRYEWLTRRFGELAPDHPIDVLDIGGGQYGVLAKVMYGDRVTVADIGGRLDYVARQGIRTESWNLAGDDAPSFGPFDFIIFSEVIEHLPMPGHIPLERLRRLLRPGGTLICTTPNFFRLRNIVYVALGKQIYDHFRYPEDEGLGHVIEYDRERLLWQLQRAGYENIAISYEHFPHRPYNRLFGAMSALGAPLFKVPRFRDVLVAIAHAPAQA